MPDKALKPYLLTLFLLFCASFLAGMLALTPVRKEATQAFKAEPRVLHRAISTWGVSG